MKKEVEAQKEMKTKGKPEKIIHVLSCFSHSAYKYPRYPSATYHIRLWSQRVTEVHRSHHTVTSRWVHHFDSRSRLGCCCSLIFSHSACNFHGGTNDSSAYVVLDQPVVTKRQKGSYRLHITATSLYNSHDPRESKSKQINLLVRCITIQLTS